jgi:hypothetical protein
VLSQSSTSLTVAENSLAKLIGIAAPVDTAYASSALTVKVAALPSNGTILLADGVTPVGIGQSLTVTQLTALKFRPALNSFGNNSSFGFTVSDPAGASVSAAATLTISAATVPVVTSWTALNVPQNTGSTPFGIPTPTDASYSSTSLSVKITALPTNGTVFLSNGTTAVTVGQTLTVAQLTGLLFKSAANGAGKISNLTYTVSDPAGKTATGRAMLAVGAATPPVTVPTQLTVATNSAFTEIGIAAPVDASFASSALTVSVTALPTDGKVVLSDGTTQVTAGQSLTVAQLTGLGFVATAGASAQTSTFEYNVTDPSGSVTAGTATLNIGPSNTPLVTTPASLTLPENSVAKPIGIKAPSDAAFSAAQLTAQVTALPTDGTVLLANGTTPVTLGQSLSISQLTGLVFKPTQDNTGKTSSFGYSVSDPAGKTATGTATLATGPNAIVLENQKPGTPQSVWQIDPGTDSTTIQGFTTNISTNLGGSVDFKINNQTGNANYQINIYRLGYYGGNGATLVTSLQHQAASAVVQPAALTDPSTGLIDAGNWQTTDSWLVPTNATSGVYIANVIDGTQVFQIPFVIRDDSSHSDIVFQTSDQTWQAYNPWGGSNLYNGNGPGFGGAAYAVSYNRPITTRDGGLTGTANDMVFSAEFPAIQWLEQNGYDVSYISGLDASANGSLLLNHQVYMDVGHDEYWTDSQRANVQAAADGGVNLMFLSGNEVYWQTRFEPSTDGSGAANRTLVSYKDTHANALIDPTGTATGTFMDARFSSTGGMSGQPSNSLTGTVFQVDSERADVIKIPYDMTQLRFWRNTSVANTAPGQSASLVQNLLGYEWDSSPDNGFRPAGLVDLSSTTLQVATNLLDYGNKVGNGTATHNLVEYRDPVSGALVFGAGTVFWSWGLSADHDQVLGAPTPTDPNVQQATVNLLADMGVQPSTLQASLVIANQSTDHTAPTSTITNVSATSVVEGQSVTVTGTAADVGGVLGGVEVSADGGTTWHPATATVGKANTTWTYTFTAGAPGTTQIKSRAVDDNLNLQTPGSGTAFTVTASPNLTIFKSTDTPATITVNDTGSVELGLKFTSATSGQISGIRFYKGPQNTGTHLGDLWTSDGTLLASATFTNETASGWQQVNFATPVRITAGTVYVASYHTNVGEYSATDFYFDNPGHTNGSLTATGNGLNGVYAYGTGPNFPGNVSFINGDNYWVDVVFNDTSQQPQANNDSGFTVTENGTLSIAASVLLANDTDPGGFPLSITGVSNGVHGTASYNASTQTVTFVPTAGYAGAASFTYTIGDTQGGTGSGQVALKVNYPTSAQSLFGTSDTPTLITVNDPSAAELGVKFTASGSGLITGIRFYKGPQNTGTHIADLWSATGTLLATATFANETASGWQQVSFSQPFFITAGTTYVASYHTNGNYSADSNYFADPLTNGELTAPSGANGIYAYGSGSVFPTNTFGASNYWVDVIFNGSSLQPPVANNDSGFLASRNTTLSIAASALLANDTDPNGLALSITGVSNPTDGTVTFNAGTQTVSFTPTAGYTGPAGFSYTISDGQASASSANVALTVVPPPPVANADSGFIANKNGTISIPASALLANDTDPNGLPLSITGVSNLANGNGTATYNAGTQTVTFTPAAGFTGTASFGYSIGDSSGASASGNVALLVNDPSSQNLFSLTAVPNQVNVNDPSSVELGVKFSASVNGTIGGIRFYKGSLNLGTHVADLWSSTGTLLATATFTNESASGWQQVNFSSPVTITAGTTYIASYHTSGNYAADSNYFSTTLTRGQLTAPANTNGVYAYGSGSIFPTSTFNASNYWVDVIYNGPAVQPPVANNDSGFVVAENGTLTIAASALLANDTDPNGLPLSIASVGSPSHGTVTYNSSAQTVSFVPTAGYAGPATFSYTIGDGQASSAAANVALTVSALPPVASNDSGFVATENNTLSIAASALIANDTDPSGLPISVTGVGNATHGTVSYDINTNTISFAPTTGYAGTASFTYSISDANGGSSTANVSLLVNDPTTTSLFNPASAPSIVTVNDLSPVELGVKFQASTGGQITGLRFYKSEQNTGAHVADLWSATGTLLATATFSNETTGGWQQVNFSNPVSITAGTTYVASYHTNGDYSADPNYFAAALTNGPLTAPSSSSSGGNGVYAYGSGSLFPTNTYNSTSYGVDVLFKAQLAA